MQFEVTANVLELRQTLVNLVKTIVPMKHSIDQIVLGQICFRTRSIRLKFLDIHDALQAMFSNHIMHWYDDYSGNNAPLPRCDRILFRGHDNKRST
jgi:hypothetical protein